MSAAIPCSSIARSVVADPGVAGGDAEGLRGLGEAEAVDGDELDDGPLVVGQGRERAVELSCHPLPVDAVGDAFGGLLVEERPPGQPAVCPRLAHPATDVVGNDVPGDAGQPGGGRAGRGVVACCAVDDGEEDVGRQVGGCVRVVDAAGDEPAYPRQVLAVERLEGVRVAADGGDVGDIGWWLHARTSPHGAEALHGLGAAVSPRSRPGPRAGPPRGPRRPRCRRTAGRAPRGWWRPRPSSGGGARGSTRRRRARWRGSRAASCG